ncbi:MAG: DNA polymerase III subunit delta [Chloroflexi bacterium]|nr:DNA polymerase III subunit delta [Chloroflexota bacterium]
MLYILSGPDDYSLTRSLEQIKREMGDQAMLSSATTTLDGQQVTLDQLSTVCQTLPFLAEKRLVIVEGLLGRFESRVRTGRPKKTPRADQSDKNEALVACLSQLPDSTVLVLLEGDLSNNNPLLKALAAKAVVKRFPLIKGPPLKQWIQQRVKEEGGSISPVALESLAKLVGSNLWVMAGEISKLVLLASGRRIEEADVRAIVSETQQVNVFAMVDAIIESKGALAGRLLQQMLLDGAAPVYLLFMLARQVGLIVRAKELSQQKKPEIEIQRKLGLNAEFAFRKTLEQAGRHSLTRLKQVYRQLLETDLAIKTGKYEAELALDILVAELCQRDRSYAASPSPN